VLNIPFRRWETNGWLPTGEPSISGCVIEMADLNVVLQTCVKNWSVRNSKVLDKDIEKGLKPRLVH